MSDLPFPVVSGLEKSIRILNRTENLKVSSIKKKGVLPIIFYSNHIRYAGVENDLSEFVLNYNKRRYTRCIVVSDEFCQRVWHLTVLTLYVADSLGLLREKRGRLVISHQSDSRTIPLKKSIDNHYAWFKKVFPYFISNKVREDIHQSRGFYIPKSDQSISRLSCNMIDPSLKKLVDRVTEYSIAFLIGHELSHVYYDHSSNILFHTVENENEADRMSMNEILKRTPDSEKIIAKYGFIVLQLAVLFDSNLKEKVNPNFPEIRSHPDDDTRLFSIFKESCKDTADERSISFVVAAMLGIWAKLFHRKDYPKCREIKKDIIESMKSFLEAAKIKA